MFSTSLMKLNMQNINAKFLENLQSSSQSPNLIFQGENDWSTIIRSRQIFICSRGFFFRLCWKLKKRKKNEFLWKFQIT